MTREPDAKFKVGDIVRVVDTPYKDCPFVWVSSMTEHCGKEAVISDVYWVDRHNTHGYLLDIDDCLCIWCDNCFVVEADLEESDSDPSVLFL